MTLITFLPHTPFKKKNVLTFLIGTVISMGKRKKQISLLTYRKSSFSFFNNFQKAISGVNLKSLSWKLRFGPIWPSLAQFWAQFWAKISKSDLKFFDNFQKAISIENLKILSWKSQIWPNFGPKAPFRVKKIKIWSKFVNYHQKSLSGTNLKKIKVWSNLAQFGPILGPILGQKHPPEDIRQCLATPQVC